MTNSTRAHTLTDDVTSVCATCCLPDALATHHVRCDGRGSAPRPAWPSPRAAG